MRICADLGHIMTRTEFDQACQVTVQSLSLLVHSTSNMATSKDFSIAIYGATGFTGKLVAGYLAETTDLTLALAARSKDKLDALAADLRQDYPSARFELFPVALDDREGLVSLFRRAKVVASLAGPYNRLGTPVLQAAIDAGAHYVDLTGELIWMKRMQATFEASAKAKGVAIVHSCGCDSIPYDLPTYWAAKALQEKTGSRSAALGRVRTGLFADGGSFSGGTFASVLDLVSTSTWSELYEAVYNPYILSPGTLLRFRCYISRHAGSQRQARFSGLGGAREWSLWRPLAGRRHE